MKSKNNIRLTDLEPIAVGDLKLTYGKVSEVQAQMVANWKDEHIIEVIECFVKGSNNFDNEEFALYKAKRTGESAKPRHKDSLFQGENGQDFRDVVHASLFNDRDLNGWTSLLYENALFAMLFASDACAIGDENGVGAEVDFISPNSLIGQMEMLFDLRQTPAYAEALKAAKERFEQKQAQKEAKKKE